MLFVLNSFLAFGANCGGAVQCNCGDTLNESQTMWYDLVNCSGNGLIIGANNTILDCNNHMIDGTRTLLYAGIYISEKNNIVIRNCYVGEFGSYGIYFYGFNSNITNNNVSDNGYGITGSGIVLSGSTNNIISSNIAELNRYNGIYFVNSNNNTVANNIVKSNDRYGINLDSSSNNIISSNIAKLNKDDGIWIHSSNNFLYLFLSNSIKNTIPKSFWIIQNYMVI